MKKVIFDRYLEFNCYYVMTRQLYRSGFITRSEYQAANSKIKQMEIDLISPKSRHNHHPRKLTVIE